MQMRIRSAAIAPDYRLTNAAVTAYPVGRSAGSAGLTVSSERSCAPTTATWVDLGA